MNFSSQLSNRFSLKNVLFLSGCEYDAKSQINYDNVIERIESFSKICHLFLVKLTVIMIVIPPFILTYVGYYVFDLGDKAFQDLPMM